MKIFLISANTALSPYPVYPLGLSMVAAALVNAGHTVRQSDVLLHKSSVEELIREMMEFAPGLVGISVRNIDNVNLVNEQYYIESIKNIVSELRKVSDVKILLGGSGFSLVPELILLETGADYGIIGEGELLVVEFADNAAKGIYPDKKLLGPATGMPGQTIRSALYDDQLIGFYRKSGNIVPLQTKRGCGNSCIYCTYPLLEGGRVRSRNPVDVVDEMEMLRERHSAAYIFFVDSVFNDDDGAYIGLLDEMLRRNINIPWTAFIKPSGLTDDIVLRMKKTGFAAAEIGTDASCDTTLRCLGKSFSFRDVVECNDLFIRHGIAVSHFFMFGSPGETEETVNEGIRNILGLQRAVSFVFMGIRILPGTALARLAVREKIISQDDGLLRPAYYLSPQIDRQWLEKTLASAFADVRHCLFPADSMEDSLQALHRFGCTGPMWDKLIAADKGRLRRGNASG